MLIDAWKGRGYIFILDNAGCTQPHQYRSGAREGDVVEFFHFQNAHNLINHHS
jgi:hypothetical protein